MVYNAMYFNLSLDDFSPYPTAGLNFDAIYQCDRLIYHFPDIKINLFIPAAFCRLGEQPHYLSNFPDWVRAINALPRENYQIGLHGMYHRTSKSDFYFHRGESNNNEFKDLSYYEAEIVIGNMIEEIESAGLVYSKVFRPSRWTISCQAAGLLNEMGFTVSSLEKYRYPGIKWKSPTWDMRSEPPENTDLFVCGHTSNWTSNYLNSEKTELLRCVLDSKKYDFVFLV